MRITIQLQPRAGLRAGIDNRLRVDGIRFALQQQSSRRMGDQVNERILRGANQPFRVFGFIVGRHMQTRNDHLQFGEQFVIEIQPVAQNVHLATCEEPEFAVAPGKLIVDFFNFLDLLSEAFCIQTVGLKG